jgi:ribosomal protein S18 acetylase RimI-like enzyme
MKIKVVTLEDDLDVIVAEINGASWDKANEISKYTVSAFKAYLQRQDTIFLACYETSLKDSALVGIASSRIEIKPYGEKFWLYVDEVDVCANQRQKGVGKFIMRKLMEIAKDEGCEEIWLGAEADNFPANALYRSLDPDDISEVTGYTYQTDA